MPYTPSRQSQVGLREEGGREGEREREVDSFLMHSDPVSLRAANLWRVDKKDYRREVSFV
jgi:hypothetical protein